MASTSTIADVPICLITGATEGIGKATAHELLKRGFHLLLLSRNAQKAEACKAEWLAEMPAARIDLYTADLSSLAQTRAAAERIAREHPRIDVLLANAGFMGFPEHTLTPEGFEATLATNHLSHVVLIHTLLPQLKASKQGRIITTSSVTHKIIKPRWEDLHLTKGYKPMQAYAHSKLMILLYSQALANRLKDTTITVYCLDPGSVYTGISRTYSSAFRLMHRIAKPFLLTPKQGAKTPVFLVTEPSLKHLSGGYFARRKAIVPAPHARDVKNIEKAWEQSLALTGLTWPVGA
jgi:retinol dehydrogenase 12